MFCHKCGNKSTEGATFCQKCGAKLIQGEAQSSVEPVSNTELKTVEHTPSEVLAVPMPTAAPKSVETTTEMAKVGNGRNEVTIHGYNKIGDFDRKIKVFRNGELVGKVGQGETITVPNDTGSTFLFKCSPMKAQYTVKAGSGELQLEWDLGKLKVFDLSSDKPLEKLEQIRKNNKKWVMAGSILAGICVIAMLIGWFMSDGGTNHVELVYNQRPFEESGVTASYKTVIDKYFTSVKWKERKGNDNIWYVDVNGTMVTDGEEMKNVALTFKVMPQNNKYLSDAFGIEVYGIDIDGELGDAKQASSFIIGLFDAYSQNHESMDSTTSNTSGESGSERLNTVDVNFEGVSLSQLIHLSADEVVALLGPPVIHDEYKLAYDAIEFDLDGGRITGAESFSPEKFLLGGTPLAQNRSLLTSLLGEPTKQGEGGSGYEMTFEQNGYVLTIATGDKDGAAWRIFISPNVESGTKSTAVGKIFYKGQPVAHLLGSTPEELNKIFGTPTGGTPVTGDYLFGEVEYHEYGEITFLFDYEGMVDSITVAADAAEMNGTALSQNRAGIIGQLATSGSVNNEFVMAFDPDTWSFLEYEQILQASVMTTGWDWDSNGKPIEVPVYKTMNFKVSMSGKALHLENVDDSDSASSFSGCCIQNS